MSIENVRAYFAERGMKDRVREFTVSSATVELAAQALGCEGSHIAKTLSFLLPDGPILLVAAGDARVDNPKFKHYFGTKAKMIPFEEVEALIGHGVGGVCPFAIKPEVRVYLDESLRRFEVIYPACGSAASAIGLTCAELERYAQNMVAWVDLCKGWRQEETGG